MRKLMHCAAMKLRTFLDVLLPRACVCCKSINPKGAFALLCPGCAKTITYCIGGRCLICGEIIGTPDMPNVRGCPKCADMPIAFRQSLCATVYSGAVKRAIHALKYGGATYAAKDLAKIALLHPEAKEFLRGAVLAPVPMHFSRKLKRGYNQTEIFARQLQKAAPELGISTAKLLVRTRRTSTQTRLKRQARIANISRAFKPSKLARGFDKTAPIVILDDVMTTAATVNECARTLKKAGFSDIRVFAAAKKI